MTAVSDLFRLEQFGIKLGLDNIRTLCSALGDPQRAFSTVIVAGTNGKGSVAAIVDHALRAAGHRCARYTSPHLTALEERFAIGGRDIDPAALERVAARVMGAIDALLREGALVAPPTFFEATTAVAFDAFREAGVEIAVLEVGLGGRLDATNVAEPLAVAITSIDRDHEQQLGSSLEAIAFEKAGVIKPGVPVVLGGLADAPREVVERIARERGADVVRASGSAPGVSVRAAPLEDTTLLELATPVRRYPPVRLGLRGAHQVANAVVAVRLLEVLDGCGVRVGAGPIARALADVRWPGRLEWLTLPEGRLLIDAAHNPAGAASLAAYLSERPGGPMPLVFGVVKDKDVRAMLDRLLPVVARVIATQAATPRALPAERLAEIVRASAPLARVAVEPDPLRAIAAALGDCGRAVAAGSIFLIGEVRGRLSK